MKCTAYIRKTVSPQMFLSLPFHLTATEAVTDRYIKINFLKNLLLARFLLRYYFANSNYFLQLCCH